MRGLILSVLRSEEAGLVGVFVLLTIILGGAASFMAGRAIAAAWRPWWHVLLFTLPIAGAVRFLHFALFEGTLLSPELYLLDTAVCMILGLVGFRTMRVRQMVTCYGWVNERAGVLGWRRRSESG